MDRCEQTRTLGFWFWVPFVTIAACSSQALCQDPHDYVPNLPYTAQVVQTYTDTEPDGTRVRHQEKLVEMCDSQGRTRIETPGVVNLYVPLQRQFIQLFPGRKTASVMTWTYPSPDRETRTTKTSSGKVFQEERSMGSIAKALGSRF